MVWNLGRNGQVTRVTQVDFQIHARFLIGQPIRLYSYENHIQRFQIGFDSNLKMPHKRKTKNFDGSKSTKIDKRIESLIPMDMWLYEYAKRLFQARWNWFKTGIYRQPSYQPFPGNSF